MNITNADYQESDELCNLAMETCALAAEANFINIDLVSRSLAYFLGAIEKNQKNYRAHFGLGILLIGGQLFEEAIKHLEYANELKPSNEILFFLEIADKAEESFRKSKVDTVVTKKKTTVNDLLNMSNKFKF